MGPSDQLASGRRWFVRLRWAAWLVLTSLSVWLVLGMDVARSPWGLVIVVAAGLVSCGALTLVEVRTGSLPTAWVWGAMLLDTALYTAFFWLTGGPSNPFTILYLVHVALATLILSRARQWVVLGSSIAGFASLFAFEGRIAASVSAGHAELMRLHLQGMLIAFVIAAAFIVAFMQRAQAVVMAAEQRARRHQRLASLTALAAGAAHELSTPLSTIAIAARELERSLVAEAEAGAALEDARLIREQVDRCRSILSQLGAGRGALAAEVPTRLTAEELVSPCGAEEGVRLTVAPSARGLELVAPRRALQRVLSSLVDNGRRSGSPEVEVRVSAEPGGVQIEVRDFGAGIPDEVMEHVGEPFFTTRESGMGLGVFLARTLLEQLGGHLELSSVVGRGTSARLWLPR